MKTRRLIFIAILIVSPVSVIHADDANHLSKTIPNKSITKDMGMMENMHKHMNKMMMQMNKIHNTTDPVKRDRLMDEHMKSMQKGLNIMTMSKSDNGMNKQDMRERINMIEKRMDMMQAMMGQMMKSNTERIQTIKIRKNIQK